MQMNCAENVSKMCVGCQSACLLTSLSPDDDDRLGTIFILQFPHAECIQLCEWRVYLMILVWTVMGIDLECLGSLYECET